MANFPSSPGVRLNEIDQTFISPAPVAVGAAIIGPTVKGPVEIPTICTSYSDYKSKFGGSFTSGSGIFSYLTSISAYNYFLEGGESLLVARVVNGTYTEATSSVITNVGETSGGSFTLQTISEGTIMNNTGDPNSDGSLSSGSKDNVRWEITGANTGSGTFNVVIRRGDDRTNDKTILETFNKVSLDPNQDNFISKRIGDTRFRYNSTLNQVTEDAGEFRNISKFVRVSSIATPTVDYFDNTGTAKAAFTGSIPVNGSGSFGGAVGGVMSNGNYYENIDSANTQGVEPGDYANMINLLSNKNDYQFNLLTVPGLTNDTHTSQITNLITNTTERGDNILVFDTTLFGGTKAEAINQASTRDTSYAATYWPWLRIQDPETGKQVYVPASTLIPGVYAFNDKIANTWNAPAGISRGGLSTVLKAKLKLNESQKSELYGENVNPIATFPRQGVVVFGQKTLQKKPSALDRVNVRRLLIELKNFIGQIGDTLVFEQNTATTRNKFIAQVTPFLETIQQKGGLFAFKVLMDDTNNTDDIIDRNQLIGEIFIQPTRTAEFISLDFVLLPTGAEFPS